MVRILSDTINDTQEWSVGTTDRIGVAVMDNDAEPTLRITNNVSMVESGNPDNNKFMTFEVTLVDAEGVTTKSGKVVTVDFTTVEVGGEGGATASDDFASTAGDFLSTSGTLTFAPVTSVADSGDSTQRIEIEIYGDTMEEADETLNGYCFQMQ